MVVLVEELERDVACTCRFGLADAGGNSIAVGDGSRNVDLEFSVSVLLLMILMVSVLPDVSL